MQPSKRRDEKSGHEAFWDHRCQRLLMAAVQQPQHPRHLEAVVVPGRRGWLLEL